PRVDQGAHLAPTHQAALREPLLFGPREGDAGRPLELVPQAREIEAGRYRIQDEGSGAIAAKLGPERDERGVLILLERVVRDALEIDLRKYAAALDGPVAIGLELEDAKGCLL